jgi:hypothetical protein
MPKPTQRKDFTSLVVKLIEERRLTELQQLIADSDQPLPETAIRMGYRLFTEGEMNFRTRFFMIRKLLEITRIPPEEHIITTLVRSMIGSQPLPVVKLVIDQLEIRPPMLKSLSRDIQEWFKSLLDNNQFQQVGQLRTILGISPDPALIQESYKNYLISGRFISFIGLSKQLEIFPLPATVQQVYSHFRQALAPGSPIPAQQRENVQKWYTRMEAVTGIADANPRLDNPDNPG